MAATYLELRAAAEWKIPPMAWWALSEDDKAYMVAYVAARSAVEAYQSQLDAAEIEAKSAARSPRGGGG